MKLTHRIYYRFKKLHKDHYIPNDLVWEPCEQKFIPDVGKTDIVPIPHEDLLADYRKAKSAIENSEANGNGHITIDTILFLPTPEELESLLDNTSATICTCPE